MQVLDIGLNNGVNIFGFLSSLDTFSFLGQIWNLLISDNIAILTFALIILLGLILLVWISREFLMWFLNTKQIAKQNQILLDKVDHLENLLKNSQRPLFPEGKGAIHQDVSTKRPLDLFGRPVDREQTPDKDTPFLEKPPPKDLDQTP